MKRLLVVFSCLMIISVSAEAQDDYCEECSNNAWAGDSIALDNFMQSCGTIDTVSYDSLNNVVEEKPIYQKITMKLNSGKVLFTDSIYLVPDQMPEYPGGFATLIKDMQDKIRYPAEAVTKKISGKVYVRMVIDKDGSLDKCSIMKGLGGGCSAEAIRVVKLLQDWSPGIKNGKPVKVQVVLPVKFALP